MMDALVTHVHLLGVSTIATACCVNRSPYSCCHLLGLAAGGSNYHTESSVVLITGISVIFVEKTTK